MMTCQLLASHRHPSHRKQQNLHSGIVLATLLLQQCNDYKTDYLKNANGEKVNSPTVIVAVLTS